MGKQVDYAGQVLRSIEGRQRQRKWGSTRFALSLQDGEITGCRVEDKDTYRRIAQPEPLPPQPAWPSEKVREIFGTWKDIRLSGQASIRVCYENGVVTILEKEDSFVMRLASIS